MHITDVVRIIDEIGISPMRRDLSKKTNIKYIVTQLEKNYSQHAEQKDLLAYLKKFI